MANKPLTLMLTLGLAGLGLTACAPTVNNRGNLVEDRRLVGVHAGSSTKQDVTKLLGSPSTTSTLDPNVWYYIGSITETESFLDPAIVQQRVLRISFNDQGVVDKVADVDTTESREIEPDEETTPTAGHEISFIEQLVGNLNREKKKKDPKKNGG